MAPKKSILIVDDDPINVKALAAVLLSKELSIAVAYSGEECLQYLVNNPAVDVILLDLMMPEKSGYEVMQALRSDERFCGIPIIIITARVARGEMEKCLQHGARDYITKPVEIDLLIDSLNQIGV